MHRVLGAVQLGESEGGVVLLGSKGCAPIAHLEGMRGGGLVVAPVRRLGAEEIISVQMFGHQKSERAKSGAIKRSPCKGENAVNGEKKASPPRPSRPRATPCVEYIYVCAVV